MASIRIQLNIKPEEYLKYYQGAVDSVLGKSVDGRMIRFPANLLRPFITHEGIHGLFEIEYDQDGKFQKMTKIN